MSLRKPYGIGIGPRPQTTAHGTAGKSPFRSLPTPTMYTQVVVARGTRLIFVSGQEAEDLQGRLVGRGDLGVQARLVFANLGRALAAASALPKDVARITIYVVNYQRDEHLPIIEEAQLRLFGDHKPANVMLSR